jgi:hypothetical protein
MFGDSLGASIWCGIVALVIGAAALFIEPVLGIVVLALGAAWYARACYRDYHEAPNLK